MRSDLGNPNPNPNQVMRSDLGIIAMMAVLGAWAAKAGGGTVALLYGLPLCFTNMWLVAYTWLQHTDVDVPHLPFELG